MMNDELIRVENYLISPGNLIHKKNYDIIIGILDYYIFNIISGSKEF